MKVPPSEVVDRFFRTGYAILPDWLTRDQLEMLTRTCDHLLSEPPDDDMGGRSHDIGRGKDRRFLRHRHRDFPDLTAFLTGPAMRSFLVPFLGQAPCLFNEQFVVKGPRTGAAFGWHQDSGYVGFDHDAYLSVWIAIDDTTEDNGPVYVLPRNLSEDQTVLPHVWNDEAKELVGYDGPEPGVAAIVPAGSIVLFSSLTLHRSSPNTTERPRRAYLAQYSAGPLIDPATGKPKTFATPL